MTEGSASRICYPGGSSLRDRAWWLLAPVAGIGIVLLGASGPYFSPPGSTVALWWPAGGLAVGFAAMTPKGRSWLAVSIVFVATLAGNLLDDHSISLSLWYAAANTIEAVVAVAILTSGHRRPAALEDLEDTARLLVAAVAASATVGLIGAAGIAMRNDGDFLGSLQTLTASHMAALLTIVPAMIAAGRRPRRKSRPFEVGVQLSLLVAAGLVAYFDPTGLPTVFLPLPILIWGALRMSTRLVSFELLVLGSIMVLGTHRGWGPFGSALTQISMADARLLLQASILVHAVVAIPTAVVACQRRLALADARTSRDELRSVLDSSQGVAIIADDLAGNITVWGAGAVAMFGYSEEEAVNGLRGRDLYSVSQAQRPDFQEFAAPLFSGADVVESDWHLRRRSGQEFVGHIRLSLRRSTTSAEWLGHLAVIEDLSRARQAEAALDAALRHEHEAVERLAALDRSKSDFISSVSHELRTPITSVIGYTDLMAAQDIPEEQRRLLDPVVRNAKRLEQLIEDLLAVSSMDRGTFVYRPGSLDLRGAVRSAVESVLAASGRCNVEVVANLGSTEIPMTGDAAQLELAVSNLVENAIKFTQDGGRVTVDVTLAGQTVVVTVADTGIGIPKAEQSKVFDRFFRSSSSTFLAIDGAGLGLHIVKQIVTAHGGRVSFESVENRGSSFTVRLPLRQS